MNSKSEDYQGTPSFYNSREVFEKFLAHTSYYRSLQEAVGKLAFLISPETMLELGSGTGATACQLASRHPSTEIHAIDARDNMVIAGRELARQMQLKNLHFTKADMLDYVADHKMLPLFVYMLYVFHHIPDPDSHKVEFLKKCKEKIPPGGYLCIADVFIPDIRNETELESQLLRNWSARIMEAYSSVFWESLSDITEDGVSFAQDAARYSMDYERECGDMVIHRNNEFMISTSWLVDRARETGFDVILNEPVNTVGDSVVLLQNTSGL